MPIAIRLDADQFATDANGDAGTILAPGPHSRPIEALEQPLSSTSAVDTIAAALANSPMPPPSEPAEPFDLATGFPLARPAEILRYDDRTGALLPQSPIGSLEPNAPTPQQSPFTPLPFNPSMPDIASCAPLRVFRAGQDIALLLRNPAAIAARSGLPSAVRYSLVLAVVSRITRMPLFMVTLEHGPFDTAWLCTFGTDGVHRNLGAMSVDEEQFFAHATSIVSTEFGQMLVELPMPQSASLAGYAGAAQEALPRTPQTVPTGKEPCHDLDQFLRMLDQEPVPVSDPIVSRMQDLMRNVAIYLNAGTGTDAEAAHLEHELQWAAMHFPARQCQTLVRSVRAASPTYRRRLDLMKQAHFNFVTTGKGAIEPLLNEIAALEAAGVLSMQERATLQNALRPQPAVARPSMPAGSRAPAAANPLPARLPPRQSKPWWRQLIG